LHNGPAVSDALEAPPGTAGASKSDVKDFVRSTAVQTGDFDSGNFRIRISLRKLSLISGVSHQHSPHRSAVGFDGKQIWVRASLPSLTRLATAIGLPGTMRRAALSNLTARPLGTRTFWC
jgi:hypothetical protein